MRQLTAIRYNAVLGLCAAFTSSGCFLVEDYRVAPRESGPGIATPPLSRASANSSVGPGATEEAPPAPSAAGGDDAGVDALPDPSGVITDPSVATLVPTDSPSAVTDPSASVGVIPEPTATLPPDTSAVATGNVEPDAGVPPAASSSPPPECAEGSLYDATAEACIETCLADEVQAPNGRCYWFNATKTPWSAVAEMCTMRGVGWNILSVRDAEEQAFVAAQLTGDTWLGASRNRTTDSWYWLDDDTEFWTGGENGHPVVDGAFYTWGSGEPSQANDENCLRYHTGNGQWSWSDSACNNIEPFFVACKGPGPGEPMGNPASSSNPANTWGQPGGSSSGRGR